jgi:23S rRNA pseudouridine2605 synthase
MTHDNKNDDNKSDKPRHPFKSREEGRRLSFKPRDTESRPPFKPRDGEQRPSFKPRGGEDRPFRRREEPAAAIIAPAEPVEERIAKVMARAGIASRRDSEIMINEGRVSVNGVVITSPALNVSPKDVIVVDGEPLPAKERTRLWLFHKPRGLVTTAHDPQGRPTVFDALPEDLPRVVAIGRLDINTEGLLLLTNDGGLARVIAHPQTGWLRRYKVRAHGDVTQAALDGLRDGVSIEGMDYGPIEAHLDRVQGDNVWLTLGLREGKNREVKRILEYLGLNVNRLIRLSFGPFQLADLEQGLVEEIKTRILKDQLGEALATEAGVDFTSPVREPIAPFGPPPRAEKPFERKPEGRNRFEERGDHRGKNQRFERDTKPYGERKPYSERKPYEDKKPFGDRKPFGERKPFNDKKSFADKKPYNDKPYGDKKPFNRGDDKEERPPFVPRGLRPEDGPKGPVWRDKDTEGLKPQGKRIPRRGADPRAARASSAERQRETVGAVDRGEGRKVKVERVVRSPEQEAPRRERPFHRPRDQERQPDGFKGPRKGPAPRKGPPKGPPRDRRP